MNIGFLVEQIYGCDKPQKLWAFANLLYFSDALINGEIKNITPTQHQINQILMTNINLDNLIEKLNNNIYKKYRTEERTEIIECPWLYLNKETLIKCFEILGFIDNIYPKNNHYNYICIFGTTAIGVKIRFENLKKYLAQNKLSFDKIILLGSQRKLWLDHYCDNALDLGSSSAIKLLHNRINENFIDIEESKLVEKIIDLKNQHIHLGLSNARNYIYQNLEDEFNINIPTESDMMKSIFENQYDDISRDFILIDAKNKNHGSRPTTIDNVEKLLTSEINEGSFLFWSHQPFVSCQKMAVEKVFKRFSKQYPEKKFTFETCGLKGEDQSIALLFTEFVSKLNRYYAKSKI